MKTAEFKLIKSEYKSTKQKTMDTLHTKWRSIFNEYGLRNVGTLVEEVLSATSAGEEDLIADASVGTLHILCRKLLTLISLRNPEFAIRETSPADEAMAWLLENLLPVELQRTSWANEMRKVGMWAILTGTGVAKLGVSSEFVYDEPSYSGTLPKNAKHIGEDDLFPYGASTEYTDPQIQEGQVNVVCIPTTNVFSNEGATNFKEVMRWYVRHKRPLIDCLHDDRYNKKARADIPTTDFSDSNQYLADSSDETRKYAQYAEVVECFDKASRQYCVFHEGVDKPLIDWTPFPLQIHEPLHFFTPIEHPLTWRGMPFGLLIYNQARSINQLREIIKGKIGRDGKTIYLYDSAAIHSEEDVARINSARDGEWIPIDNLGEKGGDQLIKAVEFGKVNPEILRLSKMFEDDAQFMSGLDEPTRGVNSGADMTATEVNVRHQQQGLTVEDYVARNESFQEEVAADYCRLILQRWPQEKLIKVSGSTAYSHFWVAVERHRVLREFSLEIVAGSTQKLDKTTYRRQWLELLERLVGIAQYAQQEASMEMQGMPTSGVNWQQVIRITAEQFDPSVANRILNKRDPIMILQRLKEQGFDVRDLSPEFSADFKRRLQQDQTMQPQLGMQPQGGNVVPFNEATGTSAVGQEQGALPAQQDLPGFAPGRALSELMGR